MAISPKQLLERAQEQIESADELNFRGATENAFYAAYHLLKPLGVAINDPMEYSKGSHAQLIGVLLHHSTGPIKGLGYLLRDCRTRRNEARYDIESEFSLETAKVQIELVTRIFVKYRQVIDSGIITLS